MKPRTSKATTESKAWERPKMELICEGLCNPTRPAVDSAVYAARMAAKDGQPPFGDRVLWFRQHQLKYTPYEPTEVEYFYRCVVCGTRRRFGNTKWSAV